MLMTPVLVLFLLVVVACGRYVNVRGEPAGHLARRGACGVHRAQPGRGGRGGPGGGARRRADPHPLLAADGERQLGPGCARRACAP
nr:hypothetical protein [Angustibacter aerolatus]